MGRKRKHSSNGDIDRNQPNVNKHIRFDDKSTNSNNHTNEDQDRQFQNKPKKQTYKRIVVDPTRKYYQPEERESWGPNVKGKKFRKEKGKKKRCANTGAIIDGSVKSVRLDL